MEFLTKEELIEITGYRRKAEQIRQLKRQNYPIQNFDRFGTPLVLFKYADQNMKDLMDLAYLTGQRPVDLAKIEKSHVFDGYLHIVQQKTDAKLRLSFLFFLQLSPIYNHL